MLHTFVVAVPSRARALSLFFTHSLLAIILIHNSNSFLSSDQAHRKGQSGAALGRTDADVTPDMRVEIHVMELEERVKPSAKQPVKAKAPARTGRRRSVAATLPTMHRTRTASTLIKSRWLQPNTPRHGIKTIRE